MKKTKLDVNVSEEIIREKMCRERRAMMVIRPVRYPALHLCERFLLYQCAPNGRDLTRISCSWSAKSLRARLGGSQEKIYLITIQRSLSTNTDVNRETRI